MEHYQDYSVHLFIRTYNESSIMIVQSKNPAKDKVIVAQLEKNVGSPVPNCTSISPPLLVSNCCSYCSLPLWSSPPHNSLPLYRYTGTSDLSWQRNLVPSSSLQLFWIFEWTSVPKPLEILVPGMLENTLLYRPVPKHDYLRWRQ